MQITYVFHPNCIYAGLKKLISDFILFKGYINECIFFFIAESLSLTLKEVSLQMEDDAERLRIYALLTCVVTVVFDIFLGAAAFGKHFFLKFLNR